MTRLLGGSATALALLAASQGELWWRHVQFLADDKLEGREAGSAGHRLAAEYVVRRFREAGLKACGTSGYFQPVPLLQRRIDEERSSLSLMRDGTERRLRLGEEALITLRGALSSNPSPVDAPAVFVGYGLSIPEFGFDDFAGLDVRGKVAVSLTGSPSHLPGPIRAHFGSAAERGKALRNAGAAGSISISNPRQTDVPWERTVAARLRPAMAIDQKSDQEAGVALAASVSPKLAESLFEGTGHTFQNLIALATQGKPLPRFALPFRVRATVSGDEQHLHSDNVCGMLPGATKETVVLSAHLDHIGVSQPIQGDRINNGAMDNASGVATLIETARALKGRKSRRSLVFVAVTGEERGLLGSRYFAGHGVGEMVADINFDMFLPIHPMELLLVLGLEESTLRAPVERVALRLGLRVQTDPEPQRNRFIRSDQYSFILHGIPAVALKVGYEAGTAEAALQRDWTRSRYHAPSDDLSQPVDLNAAALFNRVIAELAIEVANGERPRWNESSFFRRFARQ